MIALVAWVFGSSASAGTLLGIDVDTSNIYGISTIDASMSLLGTTGIAGPAALEFAPDGTLYAFNSGSGSTLYRINPTTFAATAVGPLGLFVFEGGLAFSPDGTAYATNAGDAGAPQLMKLNLMTGAASIVGTISGGRHDINGLLWRGDGMLVGLDRVTNALLTIDPTNGNSGLIATVPPVVGGDGGMTLLNGIGYFSTSGSATSPPGTIAGSNELWQFDLFTGDSSRIGSFAPTITDRGISGLAALPEPGVTLASIFLLGRALARARASQHNTRACSLVRGVHAISLLES